MKPITYLPLILILLFVLACGFGSNNDQPNPNSITNQANNNPGNTGQTNVQQPTGKTSLEFMKEGNELFYKKKYQEATVPYQKALDLEKTSPQLSKDLWHITIDNLSIAYGISGDLEKAKGVLDYGISKDPDYPLFYYNMADIYGEKNDEDNAIACLKKAYEHKANLIAGEKIPNPETDDSFRNLMKSEKFQKAVKELK